jgi:hypothetical protein
MVLSTELGLPKLAPCTDEANKIEIAIKLSFGTVTFISGFSLS